MTRILYLELSLFLSGGFWRVRVRHDKNLLLSRVQKFSLNNKMKNYFRIFGKIGK